MGSEWSATTISSFCPFTYGKGLPAKKRNPEGYFLVYGSNGPVGTHDQPLVDEPGIVIGRKGTVGSVHFVPKPFWPIDTTFYVVSAPGRHLKYTYYLLKSIGLREMNADSAVPGLNRDAAHAKPILVPPLPEQRAIANILGSLDDKIELNRQMNKTLESMARAIFKSWFVDFLPVRAKMAAKANDPMLLLPQAEPGMWFVYAIECEGGSLYIGQTEDLRQRWLQHVSGKGGRWTKTHPPQGVAYWEKQPSREEAVEREKWLKTGYGRKWLKKEIAASARTQTGDPVRAKAEGRPTGLPDDIAGLLPDRFEDSELGELPKGWEVKSLDQIADYLNGLACQKYPHEEGKMSLPVIKIRELCQGLTENTDKATSNVPGSYIVNDGNVLFSWSGSLLIDIWTQGKAVLNQHLFKVTSENYPKWFYYYWTNHHLVEFQRIAAYKATTMGHIKRHHLADAKCCVADDNIMRIANEQIAPLFTLRINNELEARKLASLRDTLLPKLISGELRVPEAEKFVEEAAQ